MTDQVWKIIDSNGNRAEDSKIYTTVRGAQTGCRAYIDRVLQREYLYDDKLDYGAYCVYIAAKSKNNSDWIQFTNEAIHCSPESIDATHKRWEELTKEFTVIEAVVI